MKAIKFVAAVAAGSLGAWGVAFAGPALPVPEPGSLALVGVAVAALVAVGRKRK